MKLLKVPLCECPIQETGEPFPGFLSLVDYGGKANLWGPFFMFGALDITL